MSDIDAPAPVPPAAECQPMPAVRAAKTIRCAIDHWFNTYIAGSPVARSVDAYNHLRTVLVHLETEINKEL